jgi:hypothetical protein
MKLLPWREADDHERVEERLHELEESARDAAARLKRIEAELGIYKPDIKVVVNEGDQAACG